MQKTSFRQTYLNLHSLPFWLIHASALVLPFFVAFSWKGLAITATVYAFGMFFVTGVYHRYFSHRAYKTSRPFQFVLAWLAQTVCQKGVLWWASSHRHHHKYSDEPEDLHSVVQSGFWWSHMGWFLSVRYQESNHDRIRDFAKYPELRFLDIRGINIMPAVLYGIGSYLIGGAYGFLYASALPLTLLWHGTFTINSLAHVIGRRRYPTTDESKNSAVLALITHGEGWHNNHHHYQRSARQGFFWYEFDLTYYILRALSAVRLIWDLAPVPAHVIENRKNDKAVEMATRQPIIGAMVTPLAPSEPPVPPVLAQPKTLDGASSTTL